MKKGNAEKTVRPLGDRVLVRELSETGGEKRTESGIYIPQTAKEDRETKKGKVVAVGKGRFEDGKLMPPEVKAGDTVIFTWGDKIKIDEEEYYIVRESEIAAVLK